MTPPPLGVRWDGSGVDVAVYSESAMQVDVCLFDDAGAERRIALPHLESHVHYGYLEGVGPGQRYGLRVHGTWDPATGQRANPDKLLVDPYARAIEGEVDWGPAVFGHDLVDPLLRSTVDSAPHVPRSIVVDERFDWGGDRPPATPLRDTVLYETHVRGISMRHPDVDPALRGTYAGLASRPIIDHLVGLGVTAVELLPVHHHVSEAFLADRGLTNYWGYATLGYFAPHDTYRSCTDAGAQVAEFKAMVKELHTAGLEVILDVVYNHTTEGGAGGPTLSLRGIDNATYYRLSPDDPSEYFDVTGTGNTLDVRHPATLQLIMDSLRYWVTEMHVDGFRFDLATTLARGDADFDRRSAFLQAVHQDPVLNQVKLIAEPWDVGHGGYQLGAFPAIWSEWNDRYRADVRDFWRGWPDSLAGLAHRFSGSSDAFDHDGRRPQASVNFITAHDGFTLHDLVSHDHRHNEANGEDNADGHRDTRSWNGGVEGPTDDPEVLENRRRRTFSMLTTLLLSQGVPMLLGGDELGRTQRGNNNAYCQDNEIAWYDWDAVDTELVEFTTRLLRIRAEHRVFRRQQFFAGETTLESSLDDIGWYRPDGEPMEHDDWYVSHARAISIFLNGNALGPVLPGEVQEPDSSYLVLMNAGGEALDFVVPAGLGGERWRVVIDSADRTNRDQVVRTADDWSVGAWSVVLLERDHVVPEVT